MTSVSETGAHVASELENIILLSPLHLAPLLPPLHSQEHEEDQKRVQELLEQNAQLELEMQRW